ncbi:hypothetical protein KY495_18435 [Massilia sp. PAMC28688]|uniref:metal-dependent hydrolase n=1 Tax=Massilia sp. PAMC28688 TaxID=2861283 RepID=UPI001C6329A2|nr:metal-dependent hydrolase [Massilia sp. PAMC28688]QYF92693.1 hypothetical protein KY495_18435 [Massilia sp. PAMC28688]
MPFTPFHLGAGALFKAAGGRHVSFLVFGGAQVLMDIEPLIGIIQNKPVLHGYTHTLAGALAIGVLAALIGRPLSAAVLRMSQVPHYYLTWRASFAGALLGTFSHVGLDALMHHDMAPWWPFFAGNDLLRIIPLDVLHILCVMLGALGGALVALRAQREGFV